jgi:hypothetical protein
VHRFRDEMRLLCTPDGMPWQILGRLIGVAQER